MITHVVLLKLKDDHRDAGDRLTQKMLALPPLIPQIKHFEVQPNIVESERNYDVILISKFDSLQTLKEYQQHPDHLVLLDYVRQVCSDLKVIDYES